MLKPPFCQTQILERNSQNLAIVLRTMDQQHVADVVDIILLTFFSQYEVSLVIICYNFEYN